MKYKTYKNENERVSIWNSGHEARVTAGPLHYLLLKGERNVNEHEPQRLSIQQATCDRKELSVTPAKPSGHHESLGGGGRATRPDRSVVCDGGV